MSSSPPAAIRYLRNLNQGYVTAQEVIDTTVVFTINAGALLSSPRLL
jgi:hypothetical protein